MLQKDRLDLVITPSFKMKRTLAQKENNNLETSSSFDTINRYTYLNKEHPALAIDATEILIKMNLDGRKK